MAEPALYVVTVTDHLLPALVGQAGCHYQSPPQDEQLARTLIRVLLGSARAPTTQVSHLLLAPGVSESEAIEHDQTSIPVMVARRRCLYGHLQRLQDHLSELGHTVLIPLADDALLAVER